MLNILFFEEKEVEGIENCDNLSTWDEYIEHAYPC